MALEKLLIARERDGRAGDAAADRVRVLFNPEEYTLNRDNNFASHAVPGLQSPLLQFVHGNMQTLEMELFLDSSEAADDPSRDVRLQTERIVAFMTIDADLHAPPVLRVIWGSLEFRCVLARVSQKFTMFLDDGRPFRARLNVTFNQYIDAEREGKEIKRQTADFTKVHRVTQGETLSGIAGRFYNNPQLWRHIAEANDIDEPRSIRGGQPLRVPAIPAHAAAASR
jgi:hypothetical protein